MSYLMGSHGVILAAAMAVSGTVVFLVLCRQRPLSPAVSNVDRGATPPASSLRPCVSGDSKESEERKAEKKEKKKKKKRVHFAEHVVDLYIERWNEEDETEGGASVVEEEPPSETRPRVRRRWSECGRQVGAGRGMPANRVALYSGILRDRLQRMPCSY